MGQKKQIKDRVLNEIDCLKTRIIEISDIIHANPELGHQEYQAAKLLTSELRKHKFKIVEGVAGMSTAFKAVYHGKSERPAVALIAEYDALPDIGHGCGHNVIAAAGIGAAIAISKVMLELDGTLIVLGTPAEEGTVDNAGGKIIMLNEFKKVDAAMMIHPSHTTILRRSSTAREALEFEFIGKAAHAASEPHKGINALEGVILTFTAINALRQHLKADERIHGIITKGGSAANTIPDHAIARVYVRAPDTRSLKELVEKVRNCVKGAALATGSKAKISNYGKTYQDVVINQTLADVFKKNLTELGVTFEEFQRGFGSSDIGNVSHVAPAIHPYMAIGPKGLVSHSIDFMKAAASQEAHEALIVAAKALAMTTIDIFSSPELMEQIRKEFNESAKEWIK